MSAADSDGQCCNGGGVQLISGQSVQLGIERSRV